ncbi:PspC domain-containing protein [Bacteroidota bacterium]
MQKKLHRSRKDRMIAGVCGGIAEYFDVDPVIIRVLFVVLTIGPGIGLLAYIVLWIVVPQGVIIIRSSEEKKTGEEQESAKQQESTSSTQDFEVISEEEYAGRKSNGKVIISIIIILVGVFWFIHNVIPGINFGHLWPLILVAVGILILLKSFKKS